MQGSLYRGGPFKIVHSLGDMHTGTKCIGRAPGLGLGDMFAVVTGLKQVDGI